MSKGDKSLDVSRREMMDEVFVAVEKEMLRLKDLRILASEVDILRWDEETLMLVGECDG